MYNREEFKRRLRYIRAGKGINTTTGAKVCGLAYTTYRGYEDDKTCDIPGIENLAKICTAYGVTADYMIFGSERESATDHMAELRREFGYDQAGDNN